MQLRNALIPLSALLYALAFLAPVVCCWFVFIFLIPLYWYVCISWKNSVCYFALQGFWWGAIFFTLHMHGILRFLIQHAPAVADGVCAGMLLVCWCALCAAGWFAVAAAAGHLVEAQYGIGGLLSVWACCTFCYLLCIDSLLFKWVLLSRGYVFANALVPLAQYDILIAGLAYFPSWVFMGCLISSSAYVAFLLWTQKGTLMDVCVLLLFLLPYGSGFLVQSTAPRFDQELFVYAQPPASTHDGTLVTPLLLAQQINDQLRHALQQFPQVAAIFFPESTFPFPLDLYDDMWHLWADNALYGAPSDPQVIMGAHHSRQDACSNAIYCFNVRRIIHTYDKTTYVPFAEYLPHPWDTIRFFSELLLKNKKKFQDCHTPVQSVVLACGLSASPYICSDLFFGYPRITATDEKDMLLWLVNDSCFGRYFQNLMFLFAKLQANNYRKTILYIGYQFGACIRPFEKHTYLASVMIPKTVN